MREPKAGRQAWSIRWRRALARFCRCECAVSAVEFSLLLPFLLLLFVGTVYVSEGIRISHKVDSVAYSVSDLVAQRTTVSSGQVDAILTAAATIMAPYSAANLTIVVSVLDVNSGAASVDWSRAYNASAQSTGDSPLETLSANVLQNGVQLVQSTVTYNYTNSVLSTLLDSLVGHSVYSFTRHFVERPRASDTIVLN